MFPQNVRSSCTLSIHIAVHQYSTQHELFISKREVLPIGQAMNYVLSLI